MPNSAVILPIHAFDASTGKWESIEASDKTTQRDTLTIATFNIWFGDLFATERHQAVADLLEAHQPDFFALQEVTRKSLSLFLQNDWIRQHYFVSDINASTFSPLHGYGVVLFSRLPVQKFRLMSLPSMMGRRFLVAEVLVNDTVFHVGTVHLESQKMSETVRGHQLKAIFENLDSVSNAIVMGDFNFCATWEKENKRILPQYTDIWAHVHPDRDGFTEDTSINVMRYNVRGKHKQVRFDRILLKSSRWQAQSIDLLGTQPIAPDLPDIFPSDHFGLLTHISMD
jgi:tyrosyl-DNA phosphodiesterase 2